MLTPWGLLLPQRGAAPGPWDQGSGIYSWLHTPEVWPDPGVHLEANIQVPEAQNTPCSPPNEQEGLQPVHLPRSLTLN